MGSGALTTDQILTNRNREMNKKGPLKDGKKPPPKDPIRYTITGFCSPLPPVAVAAPPSASAHAPCCVPCGTHSIRRSQCAATFRVLNVCTGRLRNV